MTQRLSSGTVALLVAAPLLWAGNAVVGRLVHPLISPVALNFIRWALAFIVLLPLLLNYVPHWLGLPLSTGTATHLEHMIFGALIVFFLIVEPHGLARLWSTARQKLRIWPFPH
ncbi:hypothetical protein [Rhizobium sp. 18055]|uniref:hypothetical protein n=1 Tax=Rhizobium sp. 18055 TaxID=2681403 RepID=UPI0013567A11